MTDTSTPTDGTEPEEVTSGWLFMTANALGLSDADLAYELDVREDTIRKSWKYGTQHIPDGIRDDLHNFVEFTDACVDALAARAEDLDEPALIVYSNLRDVPADHMAATYGITWWDHVAFSTRKAVPELYIGNTLEVAAAYDYATVPDAVHDDPSVVALYAKPARERLRLPHDRIRS
jgi:hypothetical protein